MLFQKIKQMFNFKSGKKIETFENSKLIKTIEKKGFSNKVIIKFKKYKSLEEKLIAQAELDIDYSKEIYFGSKGFSNTINVGTLYFKIFANNKEDLFQKVLEKKDNFLQVKKIPILKVN